MDTVHLQAGQKRLKDEYNDSDVLPKVNKADMAGIMESIEEYLRSHCNVMRAPLACIIRKARTVQTYGDYPKCLTPDNEMIVRVLNLPPDKNKWHNE